MRKPVPEKERCTKNVWHPLGAWGTYSRCERRGTVERDGMLYCAQHDPVAVEARSEKRRVGLADEFAEQERIRAATEARCVKLGGMGRPHFDYRVGKYTGAVLLSSQDADAIIDLLEQATQNSKPQEEEWRKLS